MSNQTCKKCQGPLPETDLRWWWWGHSGPFCSHNCRERYISGLPTSQPREPDTKIKPRIVTMKDLVDYLQGNDATMTISYHSDQNQWVASVTEKGTGKLNAKSGKTMLEAIEAAIGGVK